MADIFNMTDTWNDGGTDFTAIKMAVTDTASGANSNILNYSINGSHALKLTKNKQLLLADGSVSAPAIAFDSDVNTGFYRNFENQISFVCNGVERVVLTNSSIELRAASTVLFQLGNNCVLYRDDNNQLALRNGLKPQSFSIYNTYTSSSVYERLQFYWDSNNCYIQTNHASGAQRSIILDGGTTFIRAQGANKIVCLSTGITIQDELSPGTSDSSSQTLGSSSKYWHTGFINRFSGLVSSAGAPTTTELPNDKDWCIHKNTSSSAVVLAYNDGGSIKTVALS